MTIAFRLGSRAEVQPVQDAVSEYVRPTAEHPESKGSPELSTDEIAFRLFAAFRAHPHINNVLTHISRAKWLELEHALNRILDLSTTSDGLSPLEENIIELMAGERGITGKILKAYLQVILQRILEPSLGERLIRHINALHLELEWKVQHPPPVPLQSEASEELGHARREQQ